MRKPDVGQEVVPQSEQGSSIPERKTPVKNPSHPVSTVMNQVCSDFFICFDLLPLSVFEEAGGFAPGVTVLHTPGSMTVLAEFPGMEAREIDIVFFPGQLVISIEKDASSGRGTPLFESFRRKVAVPFPVDVNEIRATLDKGALMVFLPKRRGHCTQQMRIPIEKI